jgi:hypothetical protein
MTEHGHVGLLVSGKDNTMLTKGERKCKTETERTRWEDVWAWCESIRDCYGLWVEFRICPPLPNARSQVLATVTLVATRYRLGGLTEEVKMFQSVSRARGQDVTTVCLQMAVRFDKSLEDGVYDAERAAQTALHLL